jgi:signal transduction histidine kinase
LALQRLNNFQNHGDILVELDLEAIEQVLVNFIDNAVEFLDPAYGNTGKPVFA